MRGFRVLKSAPAKNFAARVFGLRPKTSRPADDEAPRRTREKTSGTQGNVKGFVEYKEYN